MSQGMLGQQARGFCIDTAVYTDLNLSCLQTQTAARRVTVPRDRADRVVSWKEFSLCPNDMGWSLAAVRPDTP